jgi:hypothetical protein
VARSMGRRSFTTLLAAEQGTEGGEDIGGQGCEAGGEVRKGARIDRSGRFGPFCETDVGFDVALRSLPRFSPAMLRLFDPCRGYLI